MVRLSHGYGYFFDTYITFTIETAGLHCRLKLVEAIKLLRLCNLMSSSVLHSSEHVSCEMCSGGRLIRCRPRTMGSRIRCRGVRLAMACVSANRYYSENSKPCMRCEALLQSLLNGAMDLIRPGFGGLMLGYLCYISSSVCRTRNPTFVIVRMAPTVGSSVSTLHLDASIRTPGQIISRNGRDNRSLRLRTELRLNFEFGLSNVAIGPRNK